MKLNLDSAAGINLVTGYGGDHVLINKERHDGNQVILATTRLPGWAPGASPG